MIPITAPYELPEFLEFEAKPIQSGDLAEMKVVREFHDRKFSIPTVTSKAEEKRVSLFWRMASSLSLRASKSAPRGSRRRIFAREITGRAPRYFQRLILTSITPAHSRGHAAGVAYSLDLGIGLPTSAHPLVSIVIPVHNQWWVTLQCLRSLQKNRDKTEFEIIIVDDASSDLTADALEALRGIRVLRLTKNVGYLRATNLGASKSRGKYIALLNNDTEPVSGWLDELVETLENDSSIAIAGSTLLYPDGTLQEAGCQIFSAGNAWNLGRGSNPLSEEFRFPREVDYCSAASILVQRAFWVDVGGFDERFAPAYCEDSDLCLTAWSKGFRVIQAPNSWVIHHEGVSHGASIGSGIKKYQVENTRKLLEKWQFALESHWRDKGGSRIEYSRKSRGIVVLCDRQFPASTRDAGSIRTIQIAKHIKSLGFHVILSAIDHSTTEFDKESLRKLGFEIQTNQENLFASLESRKSRITHCWLIRSEVFNFFEQKLRSLAPDAVFIADLLDLRYSTNTDGTVDIDPAQLRISQSCDERLLVSDVEAQILREALPGRMVRTLWAEYEPQARGTEWDTSDGAIFIGGFRHEPNVRAMLWFASEVMPRLQELKFNYPIRVVGTGLLPQDQAILHGAGLELLGRQDDLASLYQKSRIALVPLLEGRGRKGKLGEALSYGTPAITTSIGAEGFGFVQNRDAVIVDDALEMANAIVRLHDDQKVWQAMSDAGREYCKNNLSSEAMRRSIASILGVSENRYD